MAVFSAKKIVSVLPSPLEPDTVYLVRTGEGFDIYASDATGNVAHSLNASTLEGPKGDKGEKGEKGDKGDTGDKGDKGDVGDDGIATAIYPLEYNSGTKEIGITDRIQIDLSSYFGSSGWTVAGSFGYSPRIYVYGGWAYLLAEVDCRDATGSLIFNLPSASVVGIDFAPLLDIYAWAHASPPNGTDHIPIGIRIRPNAIYASGPNWEIYRDNGTGNKYIHLAVSWPIREIS